MLTLNCSQHSCRFLIYKINDKNTEIGLDQTGARDSTYAQFLAVLPDNDCRYCVYDFEYPPPLPTRSQFLLLSLSCI